MWINWDMSETLPRGDNVRPMRGLRSRIRLRRTAARLRAEDDPVLAGIGSALECRPDADEVAWVARIESERTRLESSREILQTPLFDYSLDPDHEHVFEDELGDLCRRASKPRQAALVLFGLLRELRPERCLELGTALGISASYQGAALRLNGRGRLMTVDASAARVDVARGVFSRLELDDVVDSHLGRFQDVVPDLLREGGIGYAFVDGHHDEQATLDYLELIHPALTEPRVVVFDDIAWSDGMARAWAALRGDARVAAAVEAHGMGICVYR